MNQSWIETAGKVSLYTYFLFVGMCLMALGVRVVLRKIGPASGRRPLSGGLMRLFVEYFGNTNFQEMPAESGIRDRRRNRQARVLMDRVKHEMSKREVSSDDTDQLMEELREAMRSDGQSSPS